MGKSAVNALMSIQLHDAALCPPLASRLRAVGTALCCAKWQRRNPCPRLLPTLQTERGGGPRHARAIPLQFI